MPRLGAVQQRKRLAAGSQCSKSDSTIWTSGYAAQLRLAMAAIAELGSIASTAIPRAATSVVALPVPAPTSSTRDPGSTTAFSSRSSISRAG